MTGTKIKVALLMVMTVTTSCNDQSPEEIENRIAKSDKLARVNSLCIGVAKPTGFHFVEKQIKGNSSTTSIAFYYKSDGGQDATAIFFERWLNENGWKRDPDWTLAFKKDSQTIIVERTGNPTANYVVSCSEIY